MTHWIDQFRLRAGLRQVLAARAAYDAAPSEARASWRAARLADLRRHAVERSPFYESLHEADTAAPLSELPIVRKADLIDRLDDVLTDRSLTRGALEAHVRERIPGTLVAGQYRLSPSSGSTGRPGVLPFDRGEWVDLLAAAVRSRHVIGPLPELTGRRRVAKIGSPSGWHLSVQLATTLQSRHRKEGRLSVMQPLEDVVAELEVQPPDVLIAYPSVLRRLATAQLDGRLAVAPRLVLSGGEVLTEGTRERITEAWGVRAFDQYLTGEAGFLAVECPSHAGLHVLDDHVLLEVVDRDGRPVADGELGHRVLLTALWSRTVPLIRYALDDRVRLTTDPCRCGRDTPRLVSIEGRVRELVPLRGTDGLIDIHPTAFTPVLDTAAIGGWRVRHAPDRLRVEVVDPRPGTTAEDLRTAMARSLAAAGATQVVVEVVVVPELQRLESGKASGVVPDDACCRSPVAR